MLHGKGSEIEGQLLEHLSLSSVEVHLNINLKL